MKTNSDIILDSFFKKLTKKAQVAQSAQEAPVDPARAKLSNLFKVFYNYFHNGVSFTNEGVALHADVEKALNALQARDPQSSIEIYRSNYARIKEMVKHNNDANHQFTNAMANIASIVEALGGGKVE